MLHIQLSRALRGLYASIYNYGLIMNVFCNIHEIFLINLYSFVLYNIKERPLSLSLSLKTGKIKINKLTFMLLNTHF